MVLENHPDNFDYANLPSNVREAIERNSILLKEGSHFRNQLEVFDILEAISEITQRDKKVISFGLVGSRSRSRERFSYDSEELAYRLIRYGHIFDEISSYGPTFAILKKELPESIVRQVDKLAQYLKEQLVLKQNISEITFPVELQDLVSVVTTGMLARKFRPLGLGGYIIPYPAAFFPDIDILAITGSTQGFSDIDTIGSRSGTAITAISASLERLSASQKHPILLPMLSSYQPLIIG